MYTDDVDEEYNVDIVHYIDNEYGHPVHINAQYHGDVSPLVRPTSWFRSELYGEPQIDYFDPGRSGIDSKDLEVLKRQFQKTSIEMQRWMENHDRLVEKWKEHDTTLSPPPSTTPVSVKKLFRDVKHRKSCIQSPVNNSYRELRTKIDTLSNDVKNLVSVMKDFMTTFAPSAIQAPISLPALSTVEASLSPVLQAPRGPSTSVIALEPSLYKSLLCTSID
jgi:hypothetical protein